MTASQALSRRELRGRIAVEAARLMLDEHVKEYLTAKHMAADALLGLRRSSTTPLPSNREIRRAILARSALRPEDRDARLRHMRGVAVDLMIALDDFHPRLIGSVASGAVHPASDLDLQVFTHRHDDLEHRLWLEGYEPERTEVQARKDGAFRRFVHYHFEADEVPVEISVYEPEELRRVAMSSIDGKPIDRVPIGRVRALLRRQLESMPAPVNRRDPHAEPADLAPERMPSRRR